MTDTTNDTMEAGERELRKLFETVTVNNIKAATAYADLTQKMVQDLEEKVKDLDGVIRQYNNKFEEVGKQLSALQARVYSGGS